jgi:hypothetical protein
MFDKVDGDDFMATLESELPIHGIRSVTNTLTHLTLRVPKIRMLAENLFCERRSESTTRATLQLIECCQHLDTALLTWRETVPEDWKYTSGPSGTSIPDNFDPETSEAYHGNVDVYPDVWRAKAWNSYRATRIFVQAIILRSVAWLAGGDIQNLRVISQMAAVFHAKQIVQEMVDEICASVPFHLGHLTASSKENTLTFRDKSYTIAKNSQEDRTTENLGVYFVLWPLYLARSTRIIPNDQKKWIDVRILNVASHIGLDEELVLTKLNETPAQLLFGSPDTTFTPYNK